MSKSTPWHRVTIGGATLPPTFETAFLRPAPCSGCGATQGAGHWPACPIVLAVLAFFEGLSRLHVHRVLRAAIARTGRPICEAFELGAQHHARDHDTCKRCLWSRRAHTP